MNKKRKKILIVGGTGFIGYHLAKLCKKKNWHVTSFSKNNPKKIRKLNSIKYIKGDLSYKKDLKKLKENFKNNQNYLIAIDGKTNIECFNYWVNELKENNYLHNHARMWFSSILIYTLKLPWQLGA